MTTTRPEMVDLYRRRARNYDLTANLYYLIGYREWAYRQRAVEASISTTPCSRRRRDGWRGTSGRTST